MRCNEEAAPRGGPSFLHCRLWRHFICPRSGQLHSPAPPASSLPRSGTSFARSPTSFAPRRARPQSGLSADRTIMPAMARTMNTYCRRDSFSFRKILDSRTEMTTEHEKIGAATAGLSLMA